MKTTVIFATIILLTMSSFSHPATSIVSSDEIASQVVNAFRESSSDAYLSLIPTLGEFHQIMHDHGDFYGPYLAEATADFTGYYVSDLLPSAREAFDGILRAGSAKGIDWSDISYAGVEARPVAGAPLAATGFDVLFSSQGHTYRLRVESALVIDGNWKAGHRLSLL